MKTAVTAFAAAFAVVSAFGKTGSDAAEGITSDPKSAGAKQPESYTIDVTAYDEDTEGSYTHFIDIKEYYDNPETIMEMALSYDWDLTSVAQNALSALIKIAILQAKVEWSDLRIKTLEKTVREAFANLDKMDLIDDVNNIKKTLTKAQTTENGTTTYHGGDIFNVATAQADGKSIVSNSEDKLSLYGFPSVMLDRGKIPEFAYGNGKPFLNWFFLRDLLDGTSVVAKVNVDTTQKYISNGGIQLAGWDKPTEDPNDCDESLATQLATPKKEQDPETHYVLTKYIKDGQLHYTPVGHFAGATPDETTITTNGTPKDVLQIKGGGSKNMLLVSQQGDKTPPEWSATEQLSVITDIEGELEDGTLKLKLTKKIIQAYIDPEVQQPSDPEEVELLNAPEEEVVVLTEYDTSEHEFYDQVKKVRVIESSDTSPRRRDVPTFTATEHE